MDTQILAGLFNNSVLLLAMCVVYDALALNRKAVRPALQDVFTGLILGVIGVAVMVNHWHWLQGIIFDTRSILLSVSGLFFGVVPTIIAMGVTCIYRLHLGGNGVLMGTAVILASGFIGMAWKYRSRKDPVEISFFELYLFGVVVHLVMLGLMILLPGPIFLESLAKIGIPVMVIYPVGTALLGKLMASRHRHLRAKEALRKSEERFTFAMDATNDGLWDWDIVTNKVYFSPGYYRMLGYQPNDFPMTLDSWLGLVHPDDRERTFQVNNDCVDNRTASFEVEFRMREKTGGWKWTLGRGKAVNRDGNGRALRMVGTHVDITERKKAEEEIRESESKYRRLFELESDAVLLVDVATGDIIEANQTAAELYGYTREELLMMKNVQLSTEPEKTREYTSKKSNKLVVRRHMKKDGTVFPVEISASCFSWRGRAVHIAAIRDITEREKAEEERRTLVNQLSQSQKMEAIGQLAGGVAHDFNNILTVIFGYTHILQMKIGDGDPLHTPVEQIISAATRAAELTKALLAFSRKQVLDTRPIDLAEVVLDMKKMLGRLVREDIDFRTAVPETMLIVDADKGQMGQVLINLVTNAVDAMPDGGALSIGVDSFAMNDLFVEAQGYGKPGNYARITVSDTGCGMDTETGKKVFEPFFTTKETGKGTGLGLSIVYGIIKQHNGFISVESEKGTGTTFSIYLPLAAEKSTAVPYEKSGLPSLLSGTETILLAEDDRVVRDMNEMAYREAGYRVITAVDGEDAMARFLENKGEIDLLVFDVVMPKKDGKKVYEEISSMYPDMKVLFMSGYTKDIVFRKGAPEDEILFLAKPFKPFELLKKTRELLDR